MHKFRSIVLIGAALALSTPAIAGGFYVGATLNKTDINADITFDEYNVSVDMDNAKGYGLTIGYDLNDYTAFEYELSEYGSGSTNIGPYGDIPVDFKSRSSTLWVVFDPTLFNIGTMPVKLTLRAGLMPYTKVETSLITVSGGGIAYGGGFALGVTKNLDIVLDCRLRKLNDTLDVGGYDVNFDVDVQSYNVGVKYRF